MDFLSNIADILTSFVYLLRFVLQLKKGEGKKISGYYTVNP